MVCVQGKGRHCETHNRSGALPTHCAVCHARELSICGALELRDLPAFAALSSHLQFEAGQIICEEGAPAGGRHIDLESPYERPAPLAPFDK